MIGEKIKKKGMRGIEIKNEKELKEKEDWIDEGLKIRNNEKGNGEINDEGMWIGKGKIIDEIFIIVKKERKIGKEKKESWRKRKGNREWKSVGIDVVGMEVEEWWERRDKRDNIGERKKIEKSKVKLRRL